MAEPHKSILAHTNWNDEWKSFQTERSDAKDAAHWDNRSKTFPTAHGRQDDYVSRFLELAGIKAEDTVLDMGCGTGMISIPLARQGSLVHAADISTGMLEQLRKTADDDELARITTHRMSWADNWEDFGIGENSVDVALASRSLITSDLEDSLLKLTRTAKKRACITLASAAAPHADKSFLAELGLPNPVGLDLVYTFNILAYHGFRPSISYITSHRKNTFDSIEEAEERFGRMVTSVCRELESDSAELAAMTQLRPWLERHLVENEAAGTVDENGFVQKPLRLDNPHDSVWAFVSWETR